MPLLSEKVSLKSLHTIWFQIHTIVFQLCDILEKENYRNSKKKKSVVAQGDGVGEGMNRWSIKVSETILYEARVDTWYYVFF